MGGCWKPSQDFVPRNRQQKTSQDFFFLQASTYGQLMGGASQLTWKLVGLLALNSKDGFLRKGSKTKVTKKIKRL